MPSDARPPVLFLTHHLPWPTRSGGRLREAQLLQRLAARFDIEVVAVSKVPEFDCRHVGEAHRHGVRAQVFAAQAGGAHDAGPLTRRHAAPAARDYLSHRLRRSPMVMHVQGHYLLGLVPEQVRPAVLLVEHNIESALFEQRAVHCTTPTERAEALREGARTRTDELTAWRQVRIVGAVTDGVTVPGWVPDVAPWLDAAHVVVCPLTVGGGVKMKVLEALARGCAIVATPIALQGLRHLPPGAAMERSDAPSVADACVRLLTCPQERDQQRAHATHAARHLPSWDLAADTLAGTWTELATTCAEVATAQP